MIHNSPKRGKPEPVILLTSHHPFSRMACGFDPVIFVLYNSGQVIFAKTTGDERKYFSLTLMPQEKEEFLVSLPIAEFLKLKKTYTVYPGRTYLPDSAPLVSISVFNQGASKTVTMEAIFEPPGNKDLPETLLKIYYKIARFDDPRAKPWVPQKYEVIIEPWEEFQERDHKLNLIKWPKGWPGLNSPDAKKRRNSRYSLYFKPAEFAELIQVKGYESILTRPVFLINGKKWDIDLRREVFPHE